MDELYFSMNFFSSSASASMSFRDSFRLVILKWVTRNASNFRVSASSLKLWTCSNRAP